MENDKKPTVLGLKKELGEFKEEVLELVNKLIDAQTPPLASVGIPQEVKTTEVINVEEGGAQEDGNAVKVLPPNYQVIFEEYFDPKDGFKAELSFDNNIEFTIDVPLKFSNASEAHLTYYKIDKRNKVLVAGNIEGGIADWCKLVAKNLKYNRNVVTK